MRQKIKRQALLKIFEVYQGWADNKEFACAKGCSACCTRNVMMTALEGELFLEQMREKGLQQRLTERSIGESGAVCVQTMNEWAEQCISGKYESKESIQENLESCRFLAEDQLCLIYEARPFACRCFASLSPCRHMGAASQPGWLTAVNTSVMQIVEHLGQGEIYGALDNIIPALCSRGENNDLAGFPPKQQDGGSKPTDGLRLAKPLPGLVIEQEDRETVSLFLDSLFAARVEGRSLKDILNHG
ncbi:MAG: hypothetical protein ACLFV2_03405 [Desulfurivibrionaceae bacterium]